jgi:hypothetical protein
MKRADSGRPGNFPPDDVPIVQHGHIPGTSHLSKARTALWGHLVFTSVNKRNVVFANQRLTAGAKCCVLGKGDAEHLPRPRKDWL